jgi:CRISPR system Cascade subunit CasA
MKVCEYNLLTQPLLRTIPHGVLTLPGVLAALGRDEVESFPSLRSHQGPAWHMFLVQLAAIALHRDGIREIPAEEKVWLQLLRALTSDFAQDEPWCLVVEDQSKPAFLQSPVPNGIKLKTRIPTADALDLLITSKNHDVKQAIARNGQPEDWVFALVSLQTGEGYGGSGNQGIARMYGGFSSRPMLALAPLQEKGKVVAPRAGAWFLRDVEILLGTRANEFERFAHLEYPEVGGIELTWLVPWPEGEQLQLKNLGLWFIEVCRRLRLVTDGKKLFGWKGISKLTRINGKHLNGSLGDPWAPVHKVENKGFTLSGRDFSYRTLVDLLFSGDWSLPLTASPGVFARDNDTLALIAAALARGKSKTEGFKLRVLPVGGKISRALGAKRAELHQLARAQMETIAAFDKAISGALALAAAGGDLARRKKEHYSHASDARSHFDREADGLFFEHLWARFEAQEAGKMALELEEKRFAQFLWDRAQLVFGAALPSVPCAAVFRPRADARARSLFVGAIRNRFPELFSKSDRKGEAEDEA